MLLAICYRMVWVPFLLSPLSLQSGSRLSPLLPLSHRYPQGLLYMDHEASGGRGSGEGVFYESTGEYGRIRPSSCSCSPSPLAPILLCHAPPLSSRVQSTVREVDVASGEVLNSVPQSDDVFGEGLALHDNRLYQLAWRVWKGLVYDRDTLQPRGEYDGGGGGDKGGRGRGRTQLWKGGESGVLRGWFFRIPRHPSSIVHFSLLPGSFQHGMADGWGLSVLNESIMVGTDGSSTLFHLDSSSLKAKARVTVKDGKRSIPNLNELEVVGGLVWANVWLSTCLAAIHPDTGRVLAWLDLSSLQ
ncbi:unnamed protein product [Closterium sp. Naga37s-1]|nr:unnamed protein product [Closterium sp. Naga37s-1]